MVIGTGWKRLGPISREGEALRRSSRAPFGLLPRDFMMRSARPDDVVPSADVAAGANQYKPPARGWAGVLTSISGPSPEAIAFSPSPRMVAWWSNGDVP